MTRERRVSPTGRHEEASFEGRAAGDSVVFMSKRRRSDDDQVTRMIDRIRKLVAKQRRLDEDPESEPREANRREIARLQLRLAAVVKSRLTP